MSAADNPRLDLVLARRFAAHGTSRFARFVTWVSFIGLALGVMVLTLVITVMNGFDRELKTRLLQAVPHVTIGQADRQHEVFEAARNTPGVTAVHDFFRGVGAVSVAGEVQPVAVYGVGKGARPTLSFLARHIRQGSIDNLLGETNGMLLGEPLARYLRLSIGDVVMVVMVDNTERGVVPKILRFDLAGTFELGAEPDYSMVMVNIDRMSRNDWATMGTLGLQVQLQDPLQARGIAAQLRSSAGELSVESWESAYGELFRAVQLEKSMMFVLLLLVVAIASFNIIAGQTMLVNDKRASIAILRTMGAGHSLIRNVFLIQGVFVGVTGTAIGLLLGLLAAFNINVILTALQQVTGMHLLDGSFFVEVPVMVVVSDLLVVCAMSCGLSLLAAWMPARRAAALDPVQSLH